MTTEELRRFTPKQVLNRYNLDAFSHVEFEADPQRKILRALVWWTDKVQVRPFVVVEGASKLREWAGDGWCVEIKGCM